MIIHKTALEAKVAARNRVNALALEMVPTMVEALRPFVGQKMLNQGNVISAKVKLALPAPQSGAQKWFWYQPSPYSFRVNFKADELYSGNFGENICAAYAEQSFTIGEIEGQTLKAVCNGHTARTDYAVEEVIKARAEIRSAKEALSAAESKLCGFGEYDN